MNKDIPCPVCGKKYSRNDSLKVHMKQLHNLNQRKETVETSIGYIKFEEEQLDTNCNNETVKSEHIWDICDAKHEFKSKPIDTYNGVRRKTTKGRK